MLLRPLALEDARGMDIASDGSGPGAFVLAAGDATTFSTFFRRRAL
jgi:hypothetical protein